MELMYRTRRTNRKAEHVTNRTVNLWDHDLLHQGHTHDKVATVVEMDHKLTKVSRKDIINEVL